LVLLFGPPVDEVAGVQGDAEKIGGNETKLRGADTNDTNDSAIEGGNDPTLPISTVARTVRMQDK
jgi:hypothetical protein